MRALTVLLCLSILCLLPTAYAKEVYANSSAITSCTAEAQCWFFDSALWVNGSFPELNDDIFIQDIPPGFAVYLNSSVTLASLVITSNFQLLITNSANVSIQNITLYGSARIDILNQAQVFGTNHTVILHSSELSIDGIAFVQVGAHFFLDATSSIWVFANAYLGVYL
jgi:hypothetical protein